MLEDNSKLLITAVRATRVLTFILNVTSTRHRKDRNPNVVTRIPQILDFFLLNPRTRAARVLDAKQVYASQQNLWSSCPLQLYSPMLLEAQVLGQIALLKTKYGIFIVYLAGLISSLLFTQGKPQEVRLSNLTAAKGKLDQPTIKSWPQPSKFSNQ